MRQPSQVVAGVVLALSLAAAAGAADKEAYAWPELPDAITRVRARHLPTESGLVLVDRQAHITIRSLGVEPYGIVRDEFVRFMITTEEGTRQASIDLNDDTSARVTLVEGRTVAPDGAVTPLDEERDVERLEVTTAKRKRALTSLATVRFPAPVVGAVLDLHFTTESDELAFAYAQSMVFENVPLLNTEFRVTMKSLVQGIGWSLVTLGQGRAVVGPAAEANTVAARLTAYSPPRAEPHGLPSYHEQMTLLAFMSLSSMRGVSREAGKVFHHDIGIDSYGCITGDVLPTAGIAEYWKAYLKDVAKADAKFVSRGSAVRKLNVKTVAPPSMPFEDRLRALYRLTQERLAYNPDLEGIGSVNEMLKKGMADSDHGTLLFAKLLAEAGIHRRIALVANRYRLRFSPVIHNEYLYDFARAVVVEREGEPPRFFMPGELSLPYGALPDVYQKSIALTLDPAQNPEVLFTQSNPPGVDTVTYRYDVTLDGEGNAEGSVTLAEAGAPAWGLARWNQFREYRLAHPRKVDSKDIEGFRKRWQESLDDNLEAEVVLPGKRMTADGFALAHGTGAREPTLGISCAVRGRGLAQQAGESWLVEVNPLMAGMENEFTAESRRSPIWYDTSGTVVVEGDLRLPAGASVIELPRPWELTGPLGTSASGTVEQREDGGTVILHSRIRYDVPVIVPSDAYAEWRAFQAKLVRAAQDRAIVSIPIEKEFD